MIHILLPSKELKLFKNLTTWREKKVSNSSTEHAVGLVGHG
jgi:hypothetical protein